MSLIALLPLLEPLIGKILTPKINTSVVEQKKDYTVYYVLGIFAFVFIILVILLIIKFKKNQK